MTADGGPITEAGVAYDRRRGADYSGQRSL